MSFYIIPRTSVVWMLNRYESYSAKSLQSDNVFDKNYDFRLYYNLGIGKII